MSMESAGRLEETTAVGAIQQVIHHGDLLVKVGLPIQERRDLKFVEFAAVHASTSPVATRAPAR